MNHSSTRKDRPWVEQPNKNRTIVSIILTVVIITLVIFLATVSVGNVSGQEKVSWQFTSADQEVSPIAPKVVPVSQDRLCQCGINCLCGDSCPCLKGKVVTVTQPVVRYVAPTQIHVPTVRYQTTQVRQVRTPEVSSPSPFVVPQVVGTTRVTDARVVAPRSTSYPGQVRGPVRIGIPVPGALRLGGINTGQGCASPFG